MPIPDKDLVQRVLEKHDRGQLCRQAVQAGWQAIKDKHPDVVWWRRKSTRAHIMWENTVNSALTLLAGKPGVKHVPHYDTASFLFDDVVLARFKLANVGLLTSNYQTPLAKLFDDHDENLFGLKDHHRVEIVHVLNRFKTAVDWIGVVARDHRKVIWQFELPAGGALVQPLPLPLQPKPTPAAADKVLKLVKDDSKKDKDVEKEGE